MAEKKSFWGWLKHWLFDHLSFAALEHGAKLLLEYWKVPTVSGVVGGLAGLIAVLKTAHSPVLIGLAAFIIAISTWKKWAISKQMLDRIEFNYLPRSPLDNGWKKAYKPEGTAEFGRDNDIPDSLRIKVTNSEFAMDYPVQHQAKEANHLEFTAKYVNSVDVQQSTMIFTDVEVATKDGSQCKMVWIKYYPGARDTYPTPGEESKASINRIQEQTVSLPPLKLDGNRVTLDIDFPEVVNSALGTQGWVYKSVKMVRLRGALSISPLVFSKITPRF